jgi:hypothetical protein
VLIVGLLAVYGSAAATSSAAATGNTPVSGGTATFAELPGEPPNQQAVVSPGRTT